MSKVKLKSNLGYSFMRGVKMPLVVEADEWRENGALAGYDILSSELIKAGASDEVLKYDTWPALKHEVDVIGIKPHIKLIDRREQYQQKLSLLNKAREKIKLYTGAFERGFVLMDELETILTTAELKIYRSHLST